jgi:hypothetical protein
MRTVLNLVRLGRDLVSAIRAGVIFDEPFLDTGITKNVLALG